MRIHVSGGSPTGIPSSGRIVQVEANVEAWVQRAVGKINSNSTNIESPTYTVATKAVAGLAANLPFSVNSGTFPGIAAVYSIQTMY